MKDLFTSSVSGIIAIHIATNSPVIILKGKWYKGQVSYDVLVPILDEGKAKFCNATYSNEELFFQ